MCSSMDLLHDNNIIGFERNTSCRGFMEKCFAIDSTHEFPCLSTSCKNGCCGRGVHGGGNGAVLDQHGGDGTEMDAEIGFVGTGRTPRVEMDRYADTGTGEIEESVV